MSDYAFWLDRLVLPIPPSQLTIQTPNRNKIIELIDGSEINILKEPGLKQIQFECIIPQTLYPFANYGHDNGYKFTKASVYLDEFKRFKKDRVVFLFVALRNIKDPDESKDYYENCSFKTVLWVTLEDYIQMDDAESGKDIRLAITLKEYAKYGTKTFTIKQKEITPDPAPRPVESEPSSSSRTYTVKAGDSLWAIAARELDNGSRYREIASKNGIADPNRIEVGQVLDLTGL